MPKNLEFKMKLDDRASMEEKLKEISAKEINTFKQIDKYYKVKNGLLKLRIEPEKVSLIKYARNEGEGERYSAYQFFPIPLIYSNFFDDLLDLEVRVEKIRTLYLYRNSRIHLDKVTDLGDYLEIETLVLKDNNEAETRFYDLKELLNLKDVEELRCSYRDLLIA